MYTFRSTHNIYSVERKGQICVFNWPLGSLCKMWLVCFLEETGSANRSLLSNKHSCISLFVVLLYFSKEKTHLYYNWNGLLPQVKVYFIASECFYFLIRKSADEREMYTCPFLSLPLYPVSRFHAALTSFPFRFSV